MDAHQAMEVEMSGSISDMNLTHYQKVQLAGELRVAVRVCRDRGLGVSAKWASELLSSLPAEFRIPQRHPIPPRSYPSHPQPSKTYPSTWSAAAYRRPQSRHPTELQFLHDHGIDHTEIPNVGSEIIQRAMYNISSGMDVDVALDAIAKGEAAASRQKSDMARMQEYYAGGIATPGISSPSTSSAASRQALGQAPFPHQPHLSSPFFDPTQPGVSSSTPPPPSRNQNRDRDLGHLGHDHPDYNDFEGDFESMVDAAVNSGEKEYLASLGIDGWGNDHDGGNGGDPMQAVASGSGTGSGSNGRGIPGVSNMGHRDSFGSMDSPLGIPHTGPSGMTRGYELTSTPASRPTSAAGAGTGASPLGTGVGGIGVKGSTNFVYQTPIITRPARSGLSEVQNMIDATGGEGDAYGFALGGMEESGSGDIAGEEDIPEADEDGNKRRDRSDVPYGWLSPALRAGVRPVERGRERGGPPSFDEQLKGMIAGGAGAGGNGGPLARPYGQQGQAQASTGAGQQLSFNIGWHGERPAIPPTPQQQAIPLPLPSPGNPQHPEFIGRGSTTNMNVNGNGNVENQRLHPHLSARPAGAMSSVPLVGPPETRGLGSGSGSGIHRPHIPLSSIEQQAREYVNGSASAGGGGGGYGHSGLGSIDPAQHQPRGRPLAPLRQGRQPEHIDDFEILEQDTYELAKSYFESKELERCKIVLEKCFSKRARFLSVYSQYLAADKRAQELLPHFLDSKTEMDTMTPQIYPLIEELEGEDDAYLLYLKGLLYARIGQKDRALEAYISSLHGAPYNWSCWVNVAMIVQSAEEFLEIKLLLPQGIMLAFFAIAVMLDLHSATELMMNTIDKLEETFPSSVHLKASRALVLYHMRDFDRAEKAFDEVRKIDPFRLDEIEIYSNMLYVMNKRAKLGKMAHEYAQIDKNRAEVCCLIGNYYSARNEHTKAIQYFKRSLQLNRDYLPAWTLMGHEYVEIKNSHAAVESYRRAIDCNPKDYRAWYGLGQTYELLDMPFYAVQYYSRATALRPYDCRMWSALADLYQTLKRPADAIACDYRALYGADAAQTLKILLTLADLHDSLRELTKAADCHQRYITFAERDKMHIGETARSYLYVARFHLGMLHRDKNADIGIVPMPTQTQTQPGEDAAMDKVDTPDVAALKALSPRDLEKGIEYLHKVMQSNAPAKEEAQDEWRYVQKRLNLPQPAWAQV